MGHLASRIILSRIIFIAIEILCISDIGLFVSFFFLDILHLLKLLLTWAFEIDEILSVDVPRIDNSFHLQNPCAFAP